MISIRLPPPRGRLMELSSVNTVHLCLNALAIKLLCVSSAVCFLLAIGYGAEDGENGRPRIFVIGDHGFGRRHLHEPFSVTSLNVTSPYTAFLLRERPRASLETV
jgi:hypothetical protein